LLLQSKVDYLELGMFTVNRKFVG